MKKLLIAVSLVLVSLQAVAKESLGARVMVGATTTPSVSVSLTCTAATTGTLANSFNFYRGTVSGGPYTLLGNSTTCSYSDTTVTWNTTYYYVATGVNTSTCPSGNTCESAYSNQASAVTPVNPTPNPPTGLTTGVVAVNHVPLEWEAPSEAVTAYRVFRGLTTSSFKQIASGVKKTSFIDKQAGQGDYFYEVKAVVNENGSVVVSPPSNVINVQVP